MSPRLRCAKRRYPNRRAAEAALAGIALKAAMGKDTRRETRIYECPRCEGWHTTSRPREDHGDWLTATEVARRCGIDRNDVIGICMKTHIRVCQGRINLSDFKLARRTKENQ